MAQGFALMTTYRPMQPTAQARRRLPECGRIRLGRKVATQSGKERPDKLSTLRFTSETRTLIEAIAELYGGIVQSWRNGNRAEWEVITDATEIPVVLPPDPLGDGACYEMWAGGSLQRRCDGEIAVCPTRLSGDEVAMVEKACICNERQLAECKVTLRLNLIIPDIPFGGTWRLDTHSWNAEAEIPGMVEAIQAFQSAGFTRAVFGVGQHEKMVAGKKKSYIVPFLRSAVSVQQALEGAANLAAIPQRAQVREIGPARHLCEEVAAGGDDERPCLKVALCAQTGRCEREIGPANASARAEAGVEQEPGVVPAPPVDTYSRKDAQHRLLAVVNGDKARAREVWDRAGWGDAPHIPIVEFRAAVEVYLKAKYPGYQADPDDEIVEAEVVYGPDEEPFE